MIRFIADNVAMPKILTEKQQDLTQWIQYVAASYGFTIGAIHYLLCDDTRILQTNRQFLAHDYFTDIITFDYSTSSTLTGDIFISLDTVQTNALQIHEPFDRELCRVLIHGILHLTGQGDKTPETEQEMHQKEDKALMLLTDKFALTFAH